MNIKTILIVVLLGAIALHIVGVMIGLAFSIVRTILSVVFLLIVACVVLYLLEKATKKPAPRR